MKTSSGARIVFAVPKHIPTKTFQTTMFLALRFQHDKDIFVVSFHSLTTNNDLMPFLV